MFLKKALKDLLNFRDIIFSTMQSKEEIPGNIVCEPDFEYGGLYSYADYLKWTIDERLELIKGKIFRMSPAPNNRHQYISNNLSGELNYYLKNKKCLLYAAPFDVRLPKKSKKNEDIFTVLQPDLCVVCDHSKLDFAGCIGAPDIVVEILSPSNNKKELKNKYQVYEEHGVKEYWVVSPQDKTFLSYILNAEGKFIPTRLMVGGDIYMTDILPGFELNLEDVFGTMEF